RPAIPQHPLLKKRLRREATAVSFATAARRVRVRCPGVFQIALLLLLVFAAVRRTSVRIIADAVNLRPRSGDLERRQVGAVGGNGHRSVVLEALEAHGQHR
ncbi:unnamed protein product, partial [Ectocarpus fasciculatus]